jgi:hypothetical protein
MTGYGLEVTGFVGADDAPALVHSEGVRHAGR